MQYVDPRTRGHDDGGATERAEEARRDVDAHLWLLLRVAQLAVRAVRCGGTLLFLIGTGGHRPAFGLSVLATLTAG